MRLNLLILFGIILTGLGLAFLPGTIPTAKHAPGFSFTALDGKAHDLKDFKNKVVILNFWASWCAPCVKEFPRLIAAAKNNPNVVLLALSSDMNEQAVKKFLKKQNFSWKSPNIHIALDKNDVSGKLYKTFQLPETYIISPDQKIRAKLVGAEWNNETLARHIAAAQQ